MLLNTPQFFLSVAEENDLLLLFQVLYYLHLIAVVKRCNSLIKVAQVYSLVYIFVNHLHLDSFGALFE